MCMPFSRCHLDECLNFSMVNSEYWFDFSDWHCCIDMQTKCQLNISIGSPASIYGMQRCHWLSDQENCGKCKRECDAFAEKKESNIKQFYHNWICSVAMFSILSKCFCLDAVRLHLSLSLTLSVCVSPILVSLVFFMYFSISFSFFSTI